MSTALPYLTREELAALDYTYRVTTAAQMAARGSFIVPETITVDTLHSTLPEDGSPAVRWQGFGHVRGVESFSTHIMRRNGDRVEIMRSNDGTVVVAYSIGQGRTIRSFYVGSPA